MQRHDGVALDNEYRTACRERCLTGILTHALQGGAKLLIGKLGHVAIVLLHIKSRFVGVRDSYLSSGAYADHQDDRSTPGDAVENLDAAI